LPERPQVPDGGRIRLPGPDANQPVPLPVLAVPRGDRAPLDDPTLDASGAAALAEVLPARASPAPFLRLNLPDPFENRAAVRLRTALPEEAVPLPIAPRLPRP
jgi:hypothetical protein